MRKDVLVGMMLIVLLGAAAVSAKARSQSCPPGEFVKSLLEDGSISCDVPEDKNTQLTETQVENYVTNDALDLDGGTTLGGAIISTGAHTLNTDTHAGTLCSAGQYLDGDGSCQNVPAVLGVTAFSASNSNSDSINSFSWHKVEFDNVEYNDGNGYDNTNDRFIAPASGIYHFDVSVWLMGLDDEPLITLVVRKNNQLYRSLSFRNESGMGILTGSFDVKLNTNDYIEAYIANFGDCCFDIYGHPSQVGTFFNGHRVF
jgi:hypothetical protein